MYIHIDIIMNKTFPLTKFYLSYNEQNWYCFISILWRGGVVITQSFCITCQFLKEIIEFRYN